MLASLSIRDVVIIDRLDLELRQGEVCAHRRDWRRQVDPARRARPRPRRSRRSPPAAARGDAGRGQRPLRAAGGPSHAILDEHAAGRRGRYSGAPAAARRRRSLAPSSTTRRWGSACCVASARPSSRSASTKISVCSIPASTGACSTAFAGLADEVRATAAAWQAWQAARVARAEAEQALIAARRDEAFLRHAVEETSLRPQPGEEAQLAGRQAVLMHAKS